MQPPEPGHARTLRLALVAASLFVLLGVVAFASRSGFGHAQSTRPTPGYVSWVMSVFLVLFVVMTPFAVWAYGISAREWRAKRERQSFGARVARKLFFIFIIGAVFLLRIYFGKKFFSHFTQQFVRTPPHAHVLAGKDNKPVEPTFQWPVLWVSLVLLAALGVWFWLSLRKQQAVNLFGNEESQADALAATISDAIDDLEAEPDPRRAVIAAYARMETAFGRYGLTRKVSETPIEYLRRILLGLGSRAEAVTRLTSLFERAKFSRHEIDAAMKRDAIDDLRSIRADLQAAV